MLDTKSSFLTKLSSRLLNVHMREGGKEKDDVVNTCGDLVGDRLLFRGEFKGGNKGRLERKRKSKR